MLPHNHKYILEKAISLFYYGPETYRAENSENKPPSDLSYELLREILLGAKQITQDKGFSPHAPITSLSIQGCYTLVHTFNFGITNRESLYLDDGILDHLTLTHQQNHQVISMFFLFDFIDEP